MTSRPLFISVEESTVIFGPMDQVGWARASATRRPSASSSPAPPAEGPARGGEQQPGHAPRGPRPAGTGGGRSARSRPGRSRPPACCRARWTRGAPAMIDSLLARASRRPASRAARVTGSPAKPTTPLTATWASVAMRGQPLGAHHHLHPGTEPSASSGREAGVADGDHRRVQPIGPGPPAARRTGAAPRATTSKRSGHASMTSMAWVPMEPVDPTRLTVTGAVPRPVSGPAGTGRRSGTARCPSWRASSL